MYAQLVLTEVAFTGRGPNEALVTHGTWDRGLGVLTTARDPNDLVTQVSYDGLGRLTSVTPVGAFLGGACEAPPRACEPSPMTTRRGFLFGFAVGLTLSLGVALGSMFTPRATAQATTPGPTRWEYTTVRHGFDGGSWANEQGAHGWRFIGFDGGDAHVQIFERPMH